MTAKGGSGQEACGLAGVPGLSPPCRTACPLDKDVPAFLRAIASEDPERAWQIALRDNLFPGVLGWICPRPCEAVCRRSRLERSVPICRLKRWVGGREGNGKHAVPRFEPTGPAIAVIGAGPAGLAAAHDLTVLGARVSLFDGRDEPGGLLTSCIPGFRLPDQVVRDDIERILSMGMTFHPRTHFGSLEEVGGLLARGFSAVLLAVGAGDDRRPEIAGWRAGPGVFTAIEFLAEYRRRCADPACGQEGGPSFDRSADTVTSLSARPARPALGRTVVIGGGNAALDVARTAVREGGGPVEVLYRRGGEEMRVLRSEIEEARAERVRFRTHTVVTEVVWSGEQLAGVRIAGGDEESFLPVDTLVSAIGQTRALPAPSHGDTNARVFVGGDFATGPTTVADAIASGRRAAARLRAALEGDGTWPRPESALVRLREGYLAPTGTGARGGISRSQGGSLPASRGHPSGFPPADPNWNDAVADARGCLRCDQVLELHSERCVLCGECSKRCPEDSLRWIQNSRTGGFTLSVDDANCTRCGECVAGCPVGAIHWSLWTSPNRNIEYQETLAV